MTKNNEDDKYDYLFDDPSKVKTGFIVTPIWVVRYVRPLLWIVATVFFMWGGYDLICWIGGM